jgi:hypothetical protein
MVGLHNSETSDIRRKDGHWWVSGELRHRKRASCLRPGPLERHKGALYGKNVPAWMR